MQIKIIAGAIIFICIWFSLLSSLANIFETIYLFMPVGVVIFIALLTYAITKYQFLNIKLIATGVLIVAVWILTGSQLFISGQDSINMTITGLMLVLLTVFGLMLFGAIRADIRRQELLKEASGKLSGMNKKLLQLDHAKSEFISLSSHQLREPLGIIKGYTSMLVEGSFGAINKTAIIDALSKVYMSNERLINLVNTLLDISHLDEGKVDFDFIQKDVNTMVREAVDNLIIQARTKKMYLRFFPSKEKIPPIWMDEGKLSEVVINLVDNAIKYSKKGGVTIRVEKRGNIARISCSDTGIGIDKDNLKRLFEKFVRCKEGAKLSTVGTGLGLYVAKQMVTAQGGKIWAESKGPGHGSTFIIEMPIKVDKIPDPAKARKMLKPS